MRLEKGVFKEEAFRFVHCGVSESRGAEDMEGGMSRRTIEGLIVSWTSRHPARMGETRTAVVNVQYSNRSRDVRGSINRQFAHPPCPSLYIHVPTPTHMNRDPTKRGCSERS